MYMDGMVILKSCTKIIGGIFLLLSWLDFIACSVQLIVASVNNEVYLPCHVDFSMETPHPFTVHWFKENHEGPIFTWTDGQSSVISNDLKDRISVSSSSFLSLLISRVNLLDFGFYECRVSTQINAERTKNSSWILLEMSDDGLGFDVEPSSVTLIPGRTSRLECHASPSAKIRWRINGDWFQSNRHPGVHIENDSLLLSPINNSISTVNMVGFYQCVASYGNLLLGTSLAQVNMAVLDSYPETRDVTVSFDVGTDALLPCSPPSSFPSADLYLVYVNESRVALSERISLLPGGFFRIRSVQLSDASSFRCVVHNSALNKSQMSPFIIHLIVILPVNLTQRAPQILAAPLPSYVVPIGSNLTIECVSSGFPFPKLTWMKYGGHLSYDRCIFNSGALSLLHVSRNDEGTYVCQAENHVGSFVSAYTIVEIEETPRINRPLINQTVSEGDEVVFECNVTGKPRLAITWLHNSFVITSNDQISVKDRRLTISSVTASMGGFYQCYGSNQLGIVFSVARLHVLPKPRDLSLILRDETESGGKGTKNNGKTPTDDANDEVTNKRRIQNKIKKNKNANGVLLVPPTRPQVTKLSDESVMIRWDVPENKGLPILFFKVQYKDVSKSTSRWMTIDDEIAAHIHSFEVSNLRTGHSYRFRVAAVYSNHDNNQGPVSAKFFLQKEPRMKKPVVTPSIVQTKAVNSSSIMLVWQYADADLIPIEGFFVHYRATTTAAHYLKEPVIGANRRTYTLTHLLPDTVYEIKMQCFNVAGTSEFSNIFTQKTMKSEIDTISNVDMSTESSIPVPESNHNMLYLGIFGSGVLLLIISLVFFKWRQGKARRQLLATLDQTTHGDVELNGLSTTNSANKNSVDLPTKDIQHAVENGELEKLNNNVTEEEITSIRD